MTGGNPNYGFGYVALSAAAPSGGVVVSLSSDNAAATVPASVTVPAGSYYSNEFTISTTGVATATTATISASYAGATRTARLTINPFSPPDQLKPSNLSLGSTTVTGSYPTTGTVWLNGAAPTGGVVVSLSSDNAAATVPASVTVPAGQNNATFTVTTSAVTASTPATITASLNGTATSATLTIMPLLSYIDASPNNIIGGNQTNGIAALMAAAPSGGVVVALSSDNAAATVPASVTIAAGSYYSSFTITTTGVTTATTATISGSYAGATKTARLMIGATNALLTLNLDPTTVTGGYPTTGTVRLNGAAPTGGVVVSLSSDNVAAAVPASVTVAAGQNSATFTVTTSAVTASTPTTITASLGNTARTATLTIVPLLASVILNSGTVVGGNPVYGTVNISADAPSGGVVVSLSSDNAAATVPASCQFSPYSDPVVFTQAEPPVFGQAEPPNSRKPCRCSILLVTLC